tara:strand:- start:495 stop:1220 length:726 start_codon:yes stop_codon:yes gene_type:complete
MSQDISFLISFLAGILSFLSPCVLPIVPGFISYIVGKSFSDLEKNSYSKIEIMLPIIFFIFGFSIIFVIMGASIEIISDIFYLIKKQLNFLSGLLIILMGLFFLGILKIPILNIEKKINLKISNKNPLFSFLIGVAFAFGWSPCIGPILGSILSVAINDSFNGVILLSFYSIGLGVPFMIIGYSLSKSLVLISHINKFVRYIQISTGLILILTGFLIMNGSIQAIGYQLNDFLPQLEMLLI